MPAHIVAEGLAVAVTVGTPFTVAVTDAVVIHDPLVPVTVYVRVTVGVATTFAPVVAFRLVDGDQVYVVAPDAVSVFAAPGHVDASDALTDTLFTVMVRVAVLLQPVALVPVTV